MGTTTITPFLLAREAYRRWAAQRDACLCMTEQLPRSRLRTALMRALAPQALGEFRVRGDGAACAFADNHLSDAVFSDAGITAPTDVFYGSTLWAPGSSAGPKAQRSGCDWGLPEILMLVDLDSAAQVFMNSVRELPGVLDTGLDACERVYRAAYDKAITALKGQRLDGEASHACAVYFREALPQEIGSRVIDFAY